MNYEKINKESAEELNKVIKENDKNVCKIFLVNKKNGSKRKRKTK